MKPVTKFNLKSAVTPHGKMDARLLREREAFKKRAMSTPSVEKKLSITSRPETFSGNASKEPIKKVVVRPMSVPNLDANTYKTMSRSSQYRFGVLAKIVKHLRQRHQEGDDHPYTIDELLNETNQLDIAQIVKNWLATEALMNNPKIEVVTGIDGVRFAFKPVYKIRDGKTFMRLLKQRDLRGLGGIMLDDVHESLPHCDKVLKNRAAEVLVINRPVDKKKILFYNDKAINFDVDEEFQKLWRSVAVDSLDDSKIMEYLEKQGISSMHDSNPKKPIHKRQKSTSNKKRQFKKPRDNEHLADVLETYEDNTLTLKGVNP